MSTVSPKVLEELEGQNLEMRGMTWGGSAGDPFVGTKRRYGQKGTLPGDWPCALRGSPHTFW